MAVTADPQILASAVTNLLNNAFKFTRTGGRVVLKAHDKDGHVVIEVEDECGGIPESTGDPFQSFGAQRGSDRTGLGLGLAIARTAVRAHGGDIHIRNTPGKGCVFSIEVPLATVRHERCVGGRLTAAHLRRWSLAPVMRLLSPASVRPSGNQNQLTARIDRGGPPRTS